MLHDCASAFAGLSVLMVGGRNGIALCKDVEGVCASASVFNRHGAGAGLGTSPRIAVHVDNSLQQTDLVQDPRSL